MTTQKVREKSKAAKVNRIWELWKNDYEKPSMKQMVDKIMQKSHDNKTHTVEKLFNSTNAKTINHTD